jgi:hypothetical protein
MRTIQNELREKSPIRIAKQSVEKQGMSATKKSKSPVKDKRALGLPSEDMYLSRFIHSKDPMPGHSSIHIFNQMDRPLPKVKKELLEKDEFSHFNLNQMKERTSLSKQRREKIDNY